MRPLLISCAFVSLILSGAIFGFFFAWVCSTMWGLDSIDARVAIAAMQGMNASVRNAVFAPAFFATPIFLLLTALLAQRLGNFGAAVCFGLAGLIYGAGGLVLTMAINVPMNEALALVNVPDNAQEAALIWAEYSPKWQAWNQFRTVASGVALGLCGWGIFRLGQARRHSA